MLRTTFTSAPVGAGLLAGSLLLSSCQPEVASETNFSSPPSEKTNAATSASKVSSPKAASGVKTASQSPQASQKERRTPAPNVLGTLEGPVLEQQRAALVQQLQAQENERQQELEKKAADLGVSFIGPKGGHLRRFEGDQPIYWEDHNAAAAISTAVDQIQNGNPFLEFGEDVIVGLWEAGGVARASHQLFGGRVTNFNNVTPSRHATHVAGTIIGGAAMGSQLQGMAPQARIHSYDTRNIVSEMVSELATEEGQNKVFITNNSWGSVRGWSFGQDDNGFFYQWFGNFSDDGNPENDFNSLSGRYSRDSATFDNVVQVFPYASVFFSAGNDNGERAPRAGTPWRLNGRSDQVFNYDPASHPVSDRDALIDTTDGQTGFGTISDTASAKNVITVGAANDAVRNGVRDLSRSTLTSFSSCGPTDDGRIKPDLVGNGARLLSASNESDTATASLSGTSMSSPNLAGTAAVLQGLWQNQRPGESMRASMMKALLIHTADDIGNPGPDFRYGWGLVDGRAAADLLVADYAQDSAARLVDAGLTSSDRSDVFVLEHDGSGALKATIAWTDPYSNWSTTHSDRASRLVHDLNLKVTGPDGVVHLPFVMPWTGNWSDDLLNDNAVRGVNTVDNVEQVLLEDAAAGTYLVEVSVTGTVRNGGQIYSLVTDGGTIAPEKAAFVGTTETVSLPIATSTTVPTFVAAPDTVITAQVSDPAVAQVAVTSDNRLQINSLTAGQAQVALTATNEFGAVTSAQISIQVEAPSQLTQWREENELPQDGSDDLETPPNAPLPNLLYLAFGFSDNTETNLQPVVPEAPEPGLPRFIPQPEDNCLCLTFVRPQGIDQELEYVVQRSSTLVGTSWQNVEVPAEDLTTSPLPNQLEKVEVRLPATSDESLFYRLSVRVPQD